ncbi:unnamed protein product, partial [marine sediment metagenome]
ADKFTGEVVARFGWNWLSEGVQDSDKVEHNTRLASGFNWNQAEAAWKLGSVTLADAASVIYDLSNLTQTRFGDTQVIALIDVRGIIIKNETTGEGTLIVGDAGANEWSAMFGADGDAANVEPSSVFAISNELDGWDVDATNKNLKLTASGGECTYSIAIIGATSAGASGSGSGA